MSLWLAAPRLLSPVFAVKAILFRLRRSTAMTQALLGSRVPPSGPGIGATDAENIVSLQRMLRSTESESGTALGVLSWSGRAEPNFPASCGRISQAQLMESSFVQPAVWLNAWKHNHREHATVPLSPCATVPLSPCPCVRRNGSVHPLTFDHQHRSPPA